MKELDPEHGFRYGHEMIANQSMLLAALGARALREHALSDALVGEDPRRAALVALAPVRDSVMRLQALLAAQASQEEVHGALNELAELVGVGASVALSNG
jgi:hypothetical protein